MVAAMVSLLALLLFVVLFALLRRQNVISLDEGEVINVQMAKQTPEEFLSQRCKRELSDR